LEGSKQWGSAVFAELVLESIN